MTSLEEIALAEKAIAVTLASVERTVTITDYKPQPILPALLRTAERVVQHRSDPPANRSAPIDIGGGVGSAATSASVAAASAATTSGATTAAVTRRSALGAVPADVDDDDDDGSDDSVHTRKMPVRLTAARQAPAKRAAVEIDTRRSTPARRTAARLAPAKRAAADDDDDDDDDDDNTGSRRPSKAARRGKNRVQHAKAAIAAKAALEVASRNAREKSEQHRQELIKAMEMKSDAKRNAKAEQRAPAVGAWFVDPELNVSPEVLEKIEKLKRLVAPASAAAGTSPTTVYAVRGVAGTQSFDGRHDAQLTVIKSRTEVAAAAAGRHEASDVVDMLTKHVATATVASKRICLVKWCKIEPVLHWQRTPDNTLMFKARVRRAIDSTSAAGFGVVAGSLSIVFHAPHALDGTSTVKAHGRVIDGGAEREPLLTNGYFERNETFVVDELPAGEYSVWIQAASGALNGAQLRTELKVSVPIPIRPGEILHTHTTYGELSFMLRNSNKAAGKRTVYRNATIQSPPLSAASFQILRADGSLLNGAQTVLEVTGVNVYNAAVNLQPGCERFKAKVAPLASAERAGRDGAPAAAVSAAAVDGGVSDSQSDAAAYTIGTAVTVHLDPASFANALQAVVGRDNKRVQLAIAVDYKIIGGDQTMTMATIGDEFTNFNLNLAASDLSVSYNGAPVDVKKSRAKSTTRKTAATHGGLATQAAPELAIDNMLTQTVAANRIRQMVAEFTALRAHLYDTLNAALPLDAAVDGNLDGLANLLRGALDEWDKRHAAVDIVNATNVKETDATEAYTTLNNTCTAAFTSALTRLTLAVCARHKLERGKGAMSKAISDVANWFSISTHGGAANDKADEDDEGAAADAADKKATKQQPLDAEQVAKANCVVDDVKRLVKPLLDAYKASKVDDAANATHAKNIALAHFFALIARRESTGKWAKKPIVCAVPRARQGAGALVYITVDSRVLGAEGNTFYDALCKHWPADVVDAVLVRMTRNSTTHRHVLGSSFRTNGFEVLLSFRDASKGDMSSSYRARLARRVVADATNTDCNDKTKSDEDDLGLAPGVAVAVKQAELDFFETPNDAMYGAVRHWLRGTPFYERCVRAGMLRGARTWRTLKTMLSRIFVSCDTGIADLVFQVAAVYCPNNKVVDGWTDSGTWSTENNVLRAAAVLRRHLGVDVLDNATKLTAADVDAVLDHFTLVMRTYRVKGRANDESNHAAEQVTAEAAEVARNRRAGDTNAGQAAALWTDAAERALRGVPARRRRASHRYLDLAAESPRRAARRVLDAVGAFSVTSRQIQDRVVVVIGNPTFGPSCRGYRSSPAKSLVWAIARRFHTFVVNEYLTSQRCATCGGKTVETKSGVVRYRHCEHAGAAASDNKDFNAAKAMLRIALCLWVHGERPAPWAGATDNSASPSTCSSRAPAPRRCTRSSTTATTTMTTMTTNLARNSTPPKGRVA
jgi:hypothetical protein